MAQPRGLLENPTTELAKFEELHADDAHQVIKRGFRDCASLEFGYTGSCTEGMRRRDETMIQ